MLKSKSVILAALVLGVFSTISFGQVYIGASFSFGYRHHTHFYAQIYRPVYCQPVYTYYPEPIYPPVPVYVAPQVVITPAPVVVVPRPYVYYHSPVYQYSPVWRDRVYHGPLYSPVRPAPRGPVMGRAYHSPLGRGPIGPAHRSHINPSPSRHNPGHGPSLRGPVGRGPSHSPGSRGPSMGRGPSSAGRGPVGGGHRR